MSRLPMAGGAGPSAGPTAGPPPKIQLPGVRHLLAVASGKGGVGKSTVAVNLALAFSQQGKKVGLLDADIYGPSVPLMLGLQGVDPQTTAFPIEKFGLRIMSMGFLVTPEQAVIWRGPMVDRYLRQFLMALDWGQLDVLVLDLPPGTGDAQLTLCQHAPLTGAVIVTTPQEVSLLDARRGLRMFQQVNVPVLGIVENMSYFVGDDGKRYEIFRHGGGSRCAAELGLPFLGEIPIDPQIALQGDLGEPLVHSHPDRPVAQCYRALAGTTYAALEQAAARLTPPPAVEL
ncbi:MAG TPA: Mrp/NBP35 family ATP-binding protein [Gemmatales bacterium]|nr:Mrp/NBP35 family ATP-binding protein [Gemmatales bacterium]